MKSILLLSLLPASLLVSCASDSSGPYLPATGPERIEFDRARFGAYPEDVRKDPTRYIDSRVAWVGIIVSNNVTEDETGDKIRLNTHFENHYFNWRKDGRPLVVSPRGEGSFRMSWTVRKEPGASEADAVNYAAPGDLAVVYGSPESVESDGTIDLRYHYIRILGPAEFTTNQLDYGRLGDPVYKISTTSTSR